MKKSVIIILLLSLIFLHHEMASAVVGVSPGKYVMDFEPGAERNFTFTFIFDEGVEAEIYLGGDFKEYATLSTTRLNGSGHVTVSFKLPLTAEKPGVNQLTIGAKQVPGAGFGLVGNVIARVEIKVPYPGKYAEPILRIIDANVGEPVEIVAGIDNLGSDSITVSPVIRITDYSNASIEEIQLETKTISPRDIYYYQLYHPTTNYRAGDYRAFFLAEYGGESPLFKEEIFRLGRLYVEIINHTREFRSSKLNKFDIEVESFWNDPITNLYAEVFLINNVSFVTPSIVLPPWGKEVITGYFDSSSINDDIIEANITLYYDDATTNKTVTLTREKTVQDYGLFFIISGVIVVVLLLVGIILFLLWKLKKIKRR